MKQKRNEKSLVLTICMALFVAAALMMNACSGGSENGASSEARTEAVTAQDGDVLGEGSVSFPFTIVDHDGNETALEIHTDQETVGDALTELGLISGDEGEYGLYVKTVNGITADFDKDGVYWAFYVNDEYASTGVDNTPIEEGNTYSFRVE